MPKLPMPDTDEDAYAKNTKEQYEALGRFVEAFEEMIEEIVESPSAVFGGSSQKLKP